MPSRILTVVFLYGVCVPVVFVLGGYEGVRPVAPRIPEGLT